MANVSHSPRDTTLSADRLDGWKSIAGYLKRDRTTVIRWTRERGLPVHRLPGGRTGTVFALRHELDSWAGMSPAAEQTVADTPLGEFSPSSANAQRQFWRRARPHRWIAGLTVAAMALGVPAIIATQGLSSSVTAASNAQRMLLPEDPATASKFLLARDLIADRKAVGLERAIGLLQEVVRAAPDYAPGFATLAEALLLSREFGMRNDSEAFADARVAVRSAIKLSPDMALGHRLLGFLAYWADQDFAEADVQFRRSISLDPGDAYTHFWYGNILSDHGNHVLGLKALNQARWLQPGSVAIATDLAWAQWAAGQDAVAKAALGEIVEGHPDFAVAFDCLAIIALAERDYDGYSIYFMRFAALKRDVRLVENARLVRAATAQSKGAGHREILRQAIADVAQGRTRSHAWSALIASIANDRLTVREILIAADRRAERWGDAGFRLRLERTWRHDPEIMLALARRSPAAHRKV